MRSLSSRLTAVLAALLATVSIVCVWVALQITRTNLQAVDQTLHANLAAQTLSAFMPSLHDSLLRGTDLPLFDQLMAFNPNAEFYLLDATGRILKHRAPTGRVRIETISVDPIEALLGRKQDLPILGIDPKDTETPKPFSASRIDVDGRHLGYVYVVLGGEAYATAAAMVKSSSALRLTLTSLLGALLVAFAIGAAAFRLLSARLVRLAAEMVTFERSGFRVATNPAVKQAAGDEIDDLSRIYSSLAVRVAEQFSELERMERSRKELLSHLSHDLRTPLATLQAYLETLVIKGAALTPETRQEYLRSAIQFSRKIDAMTADLLELATLDMHSAPVRPEQFYVAELLHDIGQRFGLQAGGKGIKLEIAVPTPGPQLVADVGLIERLFANLIDNAVKFTPAGGSITVSVVDQSHAVVVEVMDTGIGIPEHDLDRIFETFQRVDNGIAVSGTGLGLAIAKRIADLHGGHIGVTSTPGRSTTFRITLPRRAR